MALFTSPPTWHFPGRTARWRPCHPAPVSPPAVTNTLSIRRRTRASRRRWCRPRTRLPSPGTLGQASPLPRAADRTAAAPSRKAEPTCLALRPRLLPWPRWEQPGRGPPLTTQAPMPELSPPAKARRRALTRTRAVLPAPAPCNVRAPPLRARPPPRAAQAHHPRAPPPPRKAPPPQAAPPPPPAAAPRPPRAPPPP